MYALLLPDTVACIQMCASSMRPVACTDACRKTFEPVGRERLCKYIHQERLARFSTAQCFVYTFVAQWKLDPRNTGSAISFSASQGSTVQIRAAFGSRQFSCWVLKGEALSSHLDDSSSVCSEIRDVD